MMALLSFIFFLVGATSPSADSRDKAGITFTPPEALKLISDASNAPVFDFVDSQMGYGIVGGKLSSLKWQTDKMAELAQRVLSGESPAAMPIVEEAGYRTVYNWKELKRWEFRKAACPKAAFLSIRG